jgi:acyl carrier protein
MSAVTEHAVRAFVLETLSEPIQRLGLAPEQVPDEFDLLTSGVIDSFGVIELIGEVNERFELDLDFEEMDPEGLTVLGPFSRYVAGRASTSRAARPGS